MAATRLIRLILPVAVTSVVVATASYAVVSSTGHDRSVPKQSAGPVSAQAPGTTLAVPGPPVPVAMLPKFSGGRVVPVPAGIAADCSADVGSALNAWLASVPAESTASLTAHGCYRVDGTVLVDSKQSLVIAGNGSRIVGNQGSGDRATIDTRRHVMVRRSSDVTVTDLSIEGVNASGQYLVPFANQNGVEVSRSTRVRVTALSISRVYGDGVTISGNSQDVTIDHLHVSTAGRNSIADAWGSQVTVTDNTLAGCHFVHFDVEPLKPAGSPPWSAQNVLITNNDVASPGHFFSDLGSQGAQVNNLEISHNTAHGLSIHVEVGGGHGDVSVMRHNIRVLDNTSDSQADQGLMSFTNVDGVIVSGNHQAFGNSHTASRAVVVSNSASVLVTGNWFPGVSVVLANDNVDVALNAAATAGQRTIITSQAPPAMRAYDLGSGSDAEVVTVFTYHGNGPYTVTVGAPLAHSHAADEHLVTAASTNFVANNNSTGSTPPPGWHGP